MRVGAEVESLCGRCGRTWHVVVALVEGRIARVECLECRARHRHRAGAGDAAPGERPRPRAASSRGRKRPAKAVVAADPSRPSRPFRPSDTYRVGDRIVHASFGVGVVQALSGPRRVEVLFDVGAKLLVHGREEG